VIATRRRNREQARCVSGIFMSRMACDRSAAVIYRMIERMDFRTWCRNQCTRP
jgi:hypothetical protein